MISAEERHAKEREKKGEKFTARWTGCVTAFFPSHILRTHFEDGRRYIRRRRARGGKQRGRERDARRRSHVCPSVWFRSNFSAATTTTTRAFFSFRNEVTKRWNEERNNSSLRRRRDAVYTLPFRQNGNRSSARGRKTRKNWLPRALAAVIVGSVARYLFPFRCNAPWKTYEVNADRPRNVFLDDLVA